MVSGKAAIAKAKPLTNVIGDRGENIFELAITDYKQFKAPLFKPGFLGEKWPSIDYYVELLDVASSTPFFFAQVKATQAAFDSVKQALPIQAPKKKCRSLFRVPGPTYLVGVHEPSQRAFIKAVHTPPKKGVYEIPISHELNPTNLQILYAEVLDYWQNGSHKPVGTKFP